MYNQIKVETLALLEMEHNIVANIRSSYPVESVAHQDIDKSQGKQKKCKESKRRTLESETIIKINTAKDVFFT